MEKTRARHANGDIGTENSSLSSPTGNDAKSTPNDNVSNSTFSSQTTGEKNIPYHLQPPEMRAEYFQKDRLPSIVEIKRKIPKHCYEASIATSMYYVVKDVSMIILLYYGTDILYYYVPTWFFWLVISPTYWLLQGTIMFGVFVLGHECGHGSFSRWPMFNDFMGTLLHTPLMVPYYAWKVSHKNHHKNTGNFEKDEVFYPIKKELKKERSMAPGFALGIGWFIYLGWGYKPRRVFHFNPHDPLFQKHVLAIYISLLALGGWLICLYSYYLQRGFADLAFFYFAPVFVYASWLVIMTFLHHNDAGTPWYSDKEWTYVRGQLSSVDRHYGWAHNLTHSIGTHQIHHLYPSVPHYHLEEATRHFRAAFPHLVRCNNEPILKTFVITYMKYIRGSYIDKDSSIHWYN